MVTFVYEGVASDNLLTATNIGRLCAVEDAILNLKSAGKFCHKAGGVNASCNAPNSLCNFMKPSKTMAVLTATKASDPRYLAFRPGGVAKFGRCSSESTNSTHTIMGGCLVPDRKGALGTDAEIADIADRLRKSNDTQNKQYFLTTAYINGDSKMLHTRSQIIFATPYSAPLLSAELPSLARKANCAAWLADDVKIKTDKGCNEGKKWVLANIPAHDATNELKEKWWYTMDCMREVLKTDRDCVKQMSTYDVQYTFNGFADQELLPMLEDMDAGKGAFSFAGKDGDVRIMWYEYSRLIQKYFDKVVVNDGMLSLGAMVFSFLYILFNTRDWGYTCLGMLHIVLSLPISLFIYLVFFGYEVFGTLNFLGVFVILGIGADDIFICLDCWAQSKRYVNPDDEEEDEELFAQRVYWMWNRASYAMLTTTLTTAAAFFANVISPIPPIRAFGIFTGLLCVVNYLFVISWFPGLIVLREKGRSWSYYVIAYCGCCLACLPLTFLCRKKDVQRDEDMQDPAKKAAITATSNSVGCCGKCLGITDASDDHLESTLAKVFYHKLSPLIRKYMKPLTIAFGVVMLVSVVLIATLLKPTEDAQKFLPDDNMLQHCLDVENNKPVFPSTSVPQVANLIYGIRSVDRSETDGLDMSDFGDIAWDPAFDLSDSASQLHVLAGCAALRASPHVRKVDDPNGELFCLVLGSWVGVRRLLHLSLFLAASRMGLPQDPSTDPVARGVPGELFCPMEEFRTWTVARGEAFPCTSGCPERFANFSDYLLTQQTSDMGQTAYIVQAGAKDIDSMRFDRLETVGVPKLRMMQTVFNLTLQFTDVAKVARPVIDDLDVLLAAHNAGAPAGMKAILTASKFISIVTEEKLLSSAIVGCLVSLVLAFVVVLCSTHNIWVTVYSTVRPTPPHPLAPLLNIARDDPDPLLLLQRDTLPPF